MQLENLTCICNLERHSSGSYGLKPFTLTDASRDYFQDTAEPLVGIYLSDNLTMLWYSFKQRYVNLHPIC
jgi:hypothetical protein